VKQAEKKIIEANLDKEYAGITGVPNFTKAALKLGYGADSAPLAEDRIAVTQTISGTGALRIGGAFLERHYPGAKSIYIPTPSWANHAAVFKDSGLKVEKYRYYNKDTIGLDFEGMVADIKAMPKGSIVLLHACAHNPTGVDPTEDQWVKIADAVKSGDHFAFFDMAYQGFASGDTNKDAFALRHFIKEGMRPVLAQSFAKNMVSQSSLGIQPDSLTFIGSLRRACWCLLRGLRVSRREEARRLSDQDSRAPTLLQPPSPRCPHCLRDSQRSVPEQAVAWRGQGHGRPHHHHACSPQGEPREARQQARLDPHH
jgi:hypothetical protein